MASNRDLEPTTTKNVVAAFIRTALDTLTGKPAKAAEAAHVDRQVSWKRRADGHFHPVPGAPLDPNIWALLTRLENVAGYQTCIDSLNADPLVASHLGLVSTDCMGLSIDPDQILRSLVSDVLDAGGSDAVIESKWDRFVRFLKSDKLLAVTLIPLPHLRLPGHPVRIQDDLFLDAFTDEEVSRLAQAGFLRGPPNFPLIFGETAVGIRLVRKLEKRIGDVPTRTTDAEDVGTFGARPLNSPESMSNDVLSALRLLKHSTIRAAGEVTYQPDFMFCDGVTFRGVRNWPYRSAADEFAPEEIEGLQALWATLKKHARTFDFAVRRFNLSFERDRIDDRLVDLVVSAEALLLYEIGAEDRGELKFRASVRAAKFITHPEYSQQEVFQVVKRAYDARSIIVHGREQPTDTRLPKDEAASLYDFTNKFEEIVRLTLRKALALKDQGTSVRKQGFWDSLLFSPPEMDVCRIRVFPPLRWRKEGTPSPA